MNDSKAVILFADRDLSWSRRARMDLRRRGAEVLMAQDAGSALRKSGVYAPDVLVLDAGLEGSESEGLIERFRSAIPEAEIILVESPGSSGLRGIGQGLLYSGSKPIEEKTLIDLIDEALPGRLQSGGTDRRPRHCTILCVDDDEAYLKSVARRLTRRGYTVSSFMTSEGALNALPWLKPDLAVVDIMMPGMDGLELAKEIRKTSRGSIPVVLLTGLDTEEAYFEGHERGARYFVAKSEDPQKLIDVVDYLAGDLDEAEREELHARL